MTREALVLIDAELHVQRSIRTAAQARGSTVHESHGGTIFNSGRNLHG